MSVREAMASYIFAAAQQRWHLNRPECHRCQLGLPCERGRQVSQAVDAASLVLDLAYAEASIERTRQGIPF